MKPEKVKALKSLRENWDITYRRTKIRAITNLSSEKMPLRRQWDNVFTILKEKHINKQKLINLEFYIE